METSINMSANYASFNTEDQQTITGTTTISVRNTEATEQTIHLSLTGLPTGYTAPAISDITVPAGGTSVATITVNIPHEADSGTKSIGAVVLSNLSNTELDRATLNQVTSSALRINDAEIGYTSDENEPENDNFDENDNVYDLDQDVAAGTELVIQLDLENLFDQDYDSDKSTIESITVSIDPDDEDLFEDNYEDEYDLDDLDADSKDSLEIFLPISDDADDQAYSIAITLEGEDGEGATHTVEKELRLDIKRKKDDVRIVSTTFTPASITTCSTSASVSLELKNFGTRDQNAKITAVSTELGINLQEQNIDLERFSSSRHSFKKSFPVTFKNLKVKTYLIDVKAFIKGTELIDQEIVNLQVTACPEQQNEPVAQPPAQQANEQPPSGTSQAASQGQATTTQPGANQPSTEGTDVSTLTPISSSAIVETVENSYNQEDFIVAVFIVAITIVLGLILTFFVIILRE